ncbi:Serine protease family s33, partial [Globisporangium splendens]
MSSQEQPSKRTRPPPLPELRSFDVEGKCVIKYFDLQPAAHSPSSSPTIVLVHGAPGTYKDFRYLSPLLLEKNARVVGINLPGFGGSEVLDTANYYEHISAIGAAKIVYEVLAQLCRDEQNVFIVGHSFGGHTTINLAALNLEKTKVNLRGIALLASAGHRPHRTLWPATSAVFTKVVSSEIPIVSSAAQSLVHVVYTKVVGFPNNEPTSHYVSSLVRSSTTDYELFDEHVKKVAHIPAFVAWAKDDVHIEEEISQKVSDALHPGPRFTFDKGGHNIQKTQAELLAEELPKWTAEVIASAN